MCGMSEQQFTEMPVVVEERMSDQAGDVKDQGFRVVFMHGFSQDEMGRIMRGVKSVADDPSKVAFCMSTENNLDWKIRDLIEDVTEEHAYMK